MQALLLQVSTNTPTLARRYFFKLLANIASVPVYLVMEAILPRALGPKMYGNFNFATTIFQQFLGFLDMGTSTCLYNAMSRRQKETGLITFYIKIAKLVALLSILLSILLLFPQIGNLAMPDIPLWLAPLAAIWAFLTWWGRVLRSMNDALGVTISSEMIRTIISLLGAIILSILFFCSWLNIYSLFIQQYLMLGSMALGFWFVTKQALHDRDCIIIKTLNKNTTKEYTKEFFNYSHPLFIQALLSFFLLTAERWLLQLFYGSEAQGFFALSQKVSMACFLFVSAMTPLIMRELSIAWGKKDTDEMGRLLTRFAPILYVISAYFACFTMIESTALVHFFGGEQYLAAIIPVQIMALYPLHQAYGQLATSVFHATSKTHILRNMAALECIYGFATAWFLLSPPDFFGLHLGPIGLAIKTVIIQFITVNIYLWLASRFISLNFWKNLFHQFYSLAIISSIALLSRELTLFMHFGGLDSFTRFFISGIFYTFSISIFCLIFPFLLGLSRKDMIEIFMRFKKNIPWISHG